MRRQFEVLAKGTETPPTPRADFREESLNVGPNDPDGVILGHDRLIVTSKLASSENIQQRGLRSTAVDSFEG